MDFIRSKQASPRWPKNLTYAAKRSDVTKRFHGRKKNGRKKERKKKEWPTDLKATLGGFKHFTSDLGAAPHDQRVAVSNLGTQILVGQIVGAIHVGHLAQKLDASFPQLLGNENRGLVKRSFLAGGARCDSRRGGGGWNLHDQVVRFGGCWPAGWGHHSSHGQSGALEGNTGTELCLTLRQCHFRGWGGGWRQELGSGQSGPHQRCHYKCSKEEWSLLVAAMMSAPYQHQHQHHHPSISPMSTLNHPMPTSNRINVHTPSSSLCSAK